MLPLKKVLLLTLLSLVFHVPVYGADATHPSSKKISGKPRSAPQTRPSSSSAARLHDTRSKFGAQLNSAPAKPKPIRLKIDVPCRAWVPPKVQPKVLVLCVHGLGLNSDSYENLGKRLAKAGIGAFSVDVRGFGTWIKLEGKNRVDFDACLDDVIQALQTLHTAYPQKPVILLGESMGGAIAMRVAANHPELVDGLVSSVPSGDRFHTTRNSLKVALNVMTLRGNKQIDVGTGVIDDATEDAKLKTAWKDDPLNRLKLSAKELWQFQNFMNENHRAAKKIKVTPVLMVVGMNDRLCKPKGTLELYDEVCSDDKKMMTVKHGEHLIFEEAQCSPAVFSVLVNWLDSHSSPKPKATVEPPPAN